MFDTHRRVFTTHPQVFDIISGKLLITKVLCSKGCKSDYLYSNCFRKSNDQNRVNFEEYNQQGLIELIREWYRLWIKDSNLLDEDESFVSEEWERKINLLKRRSQRLAQKISNPQADETRLDDYVIDLIKWFKDKLKAPPIKWQEPQIIMIGMNHEDSDYFIELDITFFVDEMKREDGKRGDRVKSQIYQEIFRHFKNTYLNCDEVKEKELEEPVSQHHSHVMISLSTNMI